MCKYNCAKVLQEVSEGMGKRINRAIAYWALQEAEVGQCWREVVYQLIEKISESDMSVGGRMEGGWWWRDDGGMMEADWRGWKLCKTCRSCSGVEVGPFGLVWQEKGSQHSPECTPASKKRKKKREKRVGTNKLRGKNQ